MTEAAPEPELWLIAKSLIGPVASALIGVAWRRAEEIRAGQAFSWRILILDLPSIAGIGLASGAIALWAGLPLLVAMGLACVGGHVGTQWLMGDLLPRILDKFFPKKDET